MVDFVKFECFASDVAAGVHDNALNADTDVLAVYLTNVAPDKAVHKVKADLAEIATGNGYAGPLDTQNAATKTAGVIKVVGTDQNVTADGGSVGPFRYTVLMNSTAAGSPLIGYWDKGVPVTLAWDDPNGDPFDIDFGTEMFTVG